MKRVLFPFLATLLGLVLLTACGGDEPAVGESETAVFPTPTRSPLFADDTSVETASETAVSFDGIVLTVDPTQINGPISPYIYGINFANESPELLADVQLPVNRWGGNATTRYNWQIDMSNRGSDWVFLNVPYSDERADLPDESVANQWIEANMATNTASLLTLPLIGWTPNDEAYACGFSVEKYGAQQWVEDGCGNGVAANSETLLTGNDPLETSWEIDPQFVADWVTYLTERYGTAVDGGVQFYSLDNEPMLWHHTHRDVHPEPVTYAELRDRTIAYAAAIKTADPTAQTLGPVVWGWPAYFYSAKDTESGSNFWRNPPDRQANGDVPLIEWYLQQLAAYEAENGVRLLDYLDLHYYPQSANVALTEVVDEETQAARLRAIRSLWDPSYVDESWINEPIYLIPRMREWVKANYPGTKLSISEYNFGALTHINGALAQAEVLGIFGREGLDMATLWALPGGDVPGAYVFRLFLNYDGEGGQFGDTSIAAESSEWDTLSVFAAERSTDGAVTVMIVNKSAAEQTAVLSLPSETFSDVEGFRYSAADLTAIEPMTAVDPTQSPMSFPADSITLLIFYP